MATIDVDSIQDFTPANLLKTVEYAIAHIAVGGQSYTINGRQFTRANLSELKTMREDLKAEVAEAASATGTMTAYASFNRQQ